MNNTYAISKLPARLACALAVAALVTACGGGGSSAVVPTPIVATADTTVAATPATAAKVTTAFVAAATPAAPIAFSNGFAGTDASGAPVAISGATTVAFTGGSSTAPGFSMTNGGKTATGTTTFGSCTFTFDANSPFPEDHPWAPGKSFKVDPCILKVPTAGVKADGSASNQTLTLTFGTTSGTTTKTVSVAADGSVSIAGTSVGTVVVAQTTGGN